MVDETLDFHIYAFSLPATAITAGFFLFRLAAFAFVEYKTQQVGSRYSRLTTEVMGRLRDFITKRSLISESRLKTYFQLINDLINKLCRPGVPGDESMSEKDQIRLGDVIAKNLVKYIKVHMHGQTYPRSLGASILSKYSNWFTGTREISIKDLRSIGPAATSNIASQILQDLTKKTDVRPLASINRDPDRKQAADGRPSIVEIPQNNNEGSAPLTFSSTSKGINSEVPVEVNPNAAAEFDEKAPLVASVIPKLVRVRPN